MQILLVEDDDVEAEALIRAFRKQQISQPVTIAADGVEAFKHLRGDEGYTRLLQPYIILLDLNMPRMTGLEFLALLRCDPVLKRSVVFVLTTSNRQEDKLAAYNYQIAGYLLKSRQGDGFNSLLEMLQSYRQICEFPLEKR